MGVFLNIAGDFKYANNPQYERYDEYKKFIMQFISEEEWELLRANKGLAECMAGQKMFTVNSDGKFTSCISDRYYGDFFEGNLIRDMETSVCDKKCPSLVVYPFRCDNSLPYINSLIEYVNRNKKYREENNKKYFDYEFGDN